MYVCVCACGGEVTPLLPTPMHLHHVWYIQQCVVTFFKAHAVVNLSNYGSFQCKIFTEGGGEFNFLPSPPSHPTNIPTIWLIQQYVSGTIYIDHLSTAPCFVCFMFKYALRKIVPHPSPLPHPHVWIRVNFTPTPLLYLQEPISSDKDRFKI